MALLRNFLLAAAVSCWMGSTVFGQAYGEPDTDSPGDRMIQAYLQTEAAKISEQFYDELNSRDAWEANRARRVFEYYYMLGLWPVPDKTDLKATVAGTYQGDGFVVEKLHFQSKPRLYVTANVYRPDRGAPSGQSNARLPAVLYVCGHSHRGRDGNKTAYQAHGIWFAKHGYLCLMVDTLQLGEIAAVHHGTYREDRWWWHSRGYTPAGVECWNGIRAIDYLISREDVDAERIAVTGISGGGAATFWIAAADPRVRMAVPVSGMADLPSYVSNRVINGHCDCMFLYNTFQWPWTRIAAMIAPRPLLFVNSDADSIFPMDANDRIINRLERVYSLYGASDDVDAVVSIGGHAYREDIRQAAFRFINAHLRGDPQPIKDSEVDLVTEVDNRPQHPIDPPLLRAFATDAELPTDELNTRIDEFFVPLAEFDVPSPSELVAKKSELIERLRQFSFGSFPDMISPAEVTERENDRWNVKTENQISVVVKPLASPTDANRQILWVANQDWNGELPEWLSRSVQPADAIVAVETRGIGDTRWTRKNPPNYVERSHVLLGRTVDTGRILDIIATAKMLTEQHPGQQVLVAGEGAGAVLAAYAALLDDSIAGALLYRPPSTHAQAQAPQLLNVLRICDVPDVIGLLAPKPVTLLEADKELAARVAGYYESAGASERLSRSVNEERQY
jgi:dienelactone hydrolase